MIRLNNKGQSLVLFIVIIPIILLVFVLVYDIGTAIYEKNRLSNTSYMVIDYALDNIDSIDITSKVKEKLLNDKDMANLSHTLATIDVNVPIV